MELPAGAREHETVRLEVIDITGRRIWGTDLRGDARVVDWEGCNMNGAPIPHGIYLARLQAGEWRATVKVVVE